MSETTKKANVSALTGTYESIVGAVTFPGGVGAALDKSSLNSKLVKKVTLASLQACVRNLESKFSGNCNCLTNTNCCQTCQSTSCQSTYCQSEYCQACQSTKCQQCQSCQTCQTTCQSSSCGGAESSSH